MRSVWQEYTNRKNLYTHSMFTNPNQKGCTMFSVRFTRHDSFEGASARPAVFSLCSITGREYERFEIPSYGNGCVEIYDPTAIGAARIAEGIRSMGS